MIVTEPVEGARPEVVSPAQLGGTRHLSAAQFVRDQHDSVALVASQDGRFTVFAWSPCETWSTPIASSLCCCSLRHMPIFIVQLGTPPKAGEGLPSHGLASAEVV